MYHYITSISIHNRYIPNHHRRASHICIYISSSSIDIVNYRDDKPEHKEYIYTLLNSCRCNQCHQSQQYSSANRCSIVYIWKNTRCRWDTGGRDRQMSCMWDELTNTIVSSASDEVVSLDDVIFGERLYICGIYLCRCIQCEHPRPHHIYITYQWIQNTQSLYP
jgi:hypothetical protein